MKRNWFMVVLSLMRFWVLAILLLWTSVPKACDLTAAGIRCDTDRWFVGVMIMTAFIFLDSIRMAWQQAGLRIDASGISLPAIGGPIVILWSTIPDVTQTRRGIEIRKGKKKIVISPFWFSKPAQVASTIAAYLEAARKQHHGVKASPRAKAS